MLKEYHLIHIVCEKEDESKEKDYDFEVSDGWQNVLRLLNSFKLPKGFKIIHVDIAKEMRLV